MLPKYASVDALQNFLAAEVFHHAGSGKKAAGRALGTLVEVITFYLIESWGLRHSLVIEKALAEYGYPEITHNVEYTLHPVLQTSRHRFPIGMASISGNRLRRSIQESSGVEPLQGPATSLLSGGILRNCYVVHRPDGRLVVAHLERKTRDATVVRLATLHDKPYACSSVSASVLRRA